MVSETQKPLRILVVDDEPGILFSIQQVLTGHRVDVFEDPLIAVANLSSDEYDVLIVDYKMPDLNGIDFLLKAKVLCEDAYKILLTAFAEKEMLQESINSSLINRVMEKPLRRKALLELIDDAAMYLNRVQAREREIALLQNSYRELQQDNLIFTRQLIGVNRGLKSVFSQLEQAAAQPVNVLINGEPGTGKRLIARALHNILAKEDVPFLTIDCARLEPAQVAEELFGRSPESEGGNPLPGKIELADGGTLLICEIDKLEHGIQQRLLAVLQDKELVRLGGVRSRSTDFRLIATASRDLRKCVDSGRFMEELYYSVDAFPVHIPPLRERKQDIAEMVIYFVELFSKELGREVPEIRDDVFTHLGAFHWYGNILELENAVKRVLFTLKPGEVIRPRDFTFLEKEAELLPQQETGDCSDAVEILATALNAGSLEFPDLQRMLFESLLEKCGGDRERITAIGFPDPEK